MGTTGKEGGMSKTNRLYHLAYMENNKCKTVTITRKEFGFIIDALCRMECDDIWDMYTSAEELVFYSAMEKVKQAYHAET